MECEAARRELLECDPTELEGVGDSALAVHLRSCPACRARAAALLADTEALAEALNGLAGLRGAGPEGPAAAHAAERFTPERHHGTVPMASPGSAPAAPVSVRRLLPRVLVPLAAAAALTGLVLAWPGGPFRGPGRPTADAGSGHAASPTSGREAVAARRPSGPPAGTFASGPTAATGFPESDSAFEPGLRVRVAPGQRVAVFQTRDPAVAVVWFFSAPKGG